MGEEEEDAPLSPTKTIAQMTAATSSAIRQHTVPSWYLVNLKEEKKKERKKEGRKTGLEQNARVTHQQVND